MSMKLPPASAYLSRTANDSSSVGRPTERVASETQRMHEQLAGSETAEVRVGHGDPDVRTAGNSGRIGAPRTREHHIRLKHGTATHATIGVGAALVARTNVSRNERPRLSMPPTKTPKGRPAKGRPSAARTSTPKRSNRRLMMIGLPIAAIAVFAGSLSPSTSPRVEARARPTPRTSATSRTRRASSRAFPARGTWSAMRTRP